MKLYAFAAYIEGELPRGLRAANGAIYKNQFAITVTRKIENFKELLEKNPLGEEEGEDNDRLPRAFGGRNSRDRDWVHFLLYVANPTLSIEQIKAQLPALFLDSYNVELLKLTDFIEEKLSIANDSYYYDYPEEVLHALNANQIFRSLSRANTILWSTLANDEFELSPDQNPFYGAMKQELLRLDTLTASSYTTSPVAYLFESNNQEDVTQNIDLLVTKLNEKGVLHSKNIMYFDIDRLATRYFLNRDSKRSALESETIHDILSEDFVKSLRSNTVVILYGEYDEVNAYDAGSYSVLQTFIKNLNKYIDDIQPIFIVPQNNSQVKDRVNALIDKPVLMLAGEKIPTLQEMSFQEACVRAEELAHSFGLTTDEALQEAVKTAQKDYSQQDLNAVIKDWRDKKLIQEHFPAYTDVVKRATQHKAQIKEGGALARLDGLIGLKKMKQQLQDVLDSYYAVKKRQEQGLSTAGLTLHLAFLGNPGTGKTEVAHLYAQALAESGLIKEGRILEINGIEDEGFATTLKKGIGSVIFIDEAYDVLVRPPFRLSELAAFMEKHRTDTAVILAGYKAETLNVISMNPGIKSRIAAFIDFEDYTPSEKIEIFEYFCKQADYELDSEAKKFMHEEMLNLNQRRDEGNARQVRNIFEKMVLAQSVRLHKTYAGGTTNPSKKTLRKITKEDVQTALELKEETPGIEQLEDLVGLDEVKQLVRERLLAFESEAYKVREGIIHAASRMPMHMVFKGNPGTGKTEVAKIIGKILRDKRIVGRGSFIQINKSNLVALPGQTAALVKSVFNAAVGSVLFLDEAYALNDGTPASKEAIAALMEEMDKHKNDVIFIMAGYTKEMDELLMSNPGFNSRIAFHLDFPDYSDDELVQIFHSLAQREEVLLTPSVDQYVRALIDDERHKADFGNGRSARNILHKAKIKQGVRIGKEIEKEASHAPYFYKTLTQEDFKALLDERNITLLGQEKTSKTKKSAKAELQELIGLDEVKALIGKQIAHFVQQKERVSLGFAKKPDNVSMHMAFTGAPGTGKTEVARLVGKIMKEAGLLASDSFIEAGRQDLVGQYVGHTAPKIEALFKRAMGGVLFIDEAYSLLDGMGRDSFSQEAIDALIAQMENHKDDTVVILAGYPEEIDALLDANAGFRSRVPNVLTFSDYSVDQLYSILELLAKKREYKLAAGVKEVATNAFEVAKKSKGFGNGRYVRTLLETAILEHDVQLSAKKKKTKTDYNTLTKEDFVTAIERVTKLLAHEKHMGF